jgi:hypothetical protein
MALPIDYFQPLSFQQANPVLSGIQAGQGIYAQGVQNQFLRPELQQQLQAALLKNQMMQTQNQYLPQQLQSQIGLTQAQTNAQNALPGLYSAEGKEALARAMLSGNQANLIKQETPFLLQQEQGKVFTDPILQRTWELQQAQKTGAISPDVLSAIGLSNQLPLGKNNLQNGAQQLGIGGSPAISSAQNQTPGFGGNALQNWAIFGSPLSPLMQMQLQAYGKGLDTQATNNVTQWNQGQNEASQTAQSAIDSNKYLDQLKNSYDKLSWDEKGSLAGRVPAFSSNAQLADTAARGLQLQMAQLMHFGKMTNNEINIIGQSKPGRQMNQQALDQMYSFMKAKNQQLQELPQFYAAAKNMGIDKQTADSLWMSYMNQRPAFDFTNNTANTQYRGTWKDYLNSQAINSVRSGTPYVPNPSNLSAKDLKNLSPQEKLSLRQSLMNSGNQ